MSWVEFSIDSVAEVVTKGTTPTTYGMPFTEEGVNFIKAEALNGDATLDDNGFTYISEDTHEKLKRSQLCVNDVLVTIAGANVGKCGVVREQHIPANTNQAVGIIRVDPNKASPRFIYYCFKNPKTFAICQSMGGQAAQPNINLTVLKSFVFSGPENPEEQEKIAQLIAKYDDLIENNLRRIQLLEESARLLYQEWFVHLRFPGHEQVTVTDGIPEGWGKLTVAECCLKATYGFTASATQEVIGPKLLRITDIVPRSISWTDVPYCEADETTTKKYLLKEGDIVVARTGATVGYAKRMPQLSESVVYASYLVKFTPNKSVLDDLLLGTFMESEEYKEFVRSNAGGAAQPNANAQVLGGAKLLVPTTTLQKEFRTIAAPLIEQKFMLEKQNALLAKARDLLLPKLMSGELTV